MLHVAPLAGSPWVRLRHGLIVLLAAALATPAAALPPAPLNFVDVTDTQVIQTGVEGSFNEKEVELGDIDLDGDLDVVMAVASGPFGKRRNKLYLNVHFL